MSDYIYETIQSTAETTKSGRKTVALKYLSEKHLVEQLAELSKWFQMQAELKQLENKLAELKEQMQISSQYLTLLNLEEDSLERCIKSSEESK